MRRMLAMLMIVAGPVLAQWDGPLWIPPMASRVFVPAAGGAAPTYWTDTNNPVAVWDFETTNAVATLDITGNPGHSMTNLPSVGAGATWTELSGGAHSYSFDNSDDYFSSANIASLNPSGNVFTVATWFKHPTNVFSSYQDIYTDYGADVDNRIRFGLYGNVGEQVFFGPRDRNYNNLQINGKGPHYNDATWHHLVGVCSGTVAIAYVDGEVIHAVTNGSFGVVDVYGGIQPAIGAAGDGSSGLWHGEIGEVSLYFKAFSKAEILELMNGTNPTNYLRRLP